MENLLVVDQEVRKIIVENGGRHPKSSNALLYVLAKEHWLKGTAVSGTGIQADN